jgi:hypothetical protein
MGIAFYFGCKWLFGAYSGFWWMVVRSSCFVILYGAGVLALKLSDDVGPVWNTVKKRLGLQKDKTV